MKKIVLVLLLVLLSFSLVLALLQILPTDNDIKWQPKTEIGSIYLSDIKVNQTIFWNKTLPSSRIDPSCPVYGNGSIIACLINVTTFYNETIVIKEYQEICLNSKCTDISSWDVWCYQNSTTITCLSNFDGTGLLKQKAIVKGTSYFIIDYSEKEVISSDYYKNSYTDLLKGEIDGTEKIDAK